MSRKDVWRVLNRLLIPTIEQESRIEPNNIDSSCCFSLLPLLCLTMLLALVTEVVVYFVGTTTARFYQLLLNRDWSGFWAQVLLSALLLVASALLKSALHYVGGLFALHSRSRLTLDLQSRYLQPRVFQRLNSDYCTLTPTVFDIAKGDADEFSPLLLPDSDTKHQPGTGIDNPDQRLSQDVDQWCQLIRIFVERLLSTPIMIVYYSYQTAAVAGILAPCAVYLYFLVNLLLCRPLLSPLIRLTYIRERLEGNFRYYHQRTRQFAESIHMLHGEQYENRFLVHHFTGIFDTQKSILNREYLVKTLTTFISEFGSIISFLIIAYPIFSGRYDKMEVKELSTLISQNTFYTIYLIYKFTSITEMADQYSQLVGLSNRLQDMYDQLAVLEHGLALEPVAEFYYDSDGILETFRILPRPMDLPNGKSVMLQEITVSAPTSTDTEPILLLIYGPPGIGKSCLLRRLFEHAPKRSVMFLPPRPYILPDETIEQFIAYPNLPDSSNRKEIQKILDYLDINNGLIREYEEILSQKFETIPIVNNTHYVSIERTNDGKLKKLDKRYYGCQSDPRSRDWWYRLSSGEKQKLNLARVMLFKPQYLFMDEPFSSVDQQTVRKCLQYFHQHRINCVIISHNSAVAELWPGADVKYLSLQN